MHIMLRQGIPCQSVCTTEALILIEGLSWCSIILLVRVEIKARWCFATPIKLGKKEKGKKKNKQNQTNQPKGTVYFVAGCEYMFAFLSER